MKRIFNKVEYKIVDEKGNTLAENFRTKQGAKNFLLTLKLNKQDKLEVVEMEIQLNKQEV